MENRVTFERVSGRNEDGTERRRRWTVLGVLLSTLFLIAIVTVTLALLYDRHPEPETARLVSGIGLLFGSLLFLGLLRLLPYPPFSRNVAWSLLLALVTSIVLIASIESWMEDPPAFAEPGATLRFLFVGVLFLLPIVCTPVASRLWRDSQTASPRARFAWRASAALTFLMGWAGPGFMLTIPIEDREPLFFIGMVFFLIVLAVPAVLLARRIQRPWLEGGGDSLRSLIFFVATVHGLVNLHLFVRADALAAKAREAFRKAPAVDPLLLILGLGILAYLASSTMEDG